MAQYIEKSVNKPVFSAADLAGAIGMVHQLWLLPVNAQTRLATCTGSLLKMLLALRAPAFYESRPSHPGAMTELYRDGWRDWQSDAISNELSGRKLPDITQDCIHMVWQPQPAKLSAAVRWHCVTSCLPVGVDYFVTLAIARRAQPFSERESCLLRTLHQSSAFELVSRRTGPKSLTHLTERMRDVLGALLRGRSEKEIARGLEVSRHTVHSYVKAIYRRYSVNTRAELLSRSIDPVAKRAFSTDPL